MEILYRCVIAYPEEAAKADSSYPYARHLVRAIMAERPFLSHQWNDKVLVVRIAKGLVGHGMEPILDVWEFVPGESLTKAMSSGIESSTAFVLFWSRHSAKSDNVEYERELGLTALRKRDEYRAICVRLDDTPLPSEHSFRLYLDWRKGQREGKTFDRNLTYLARAIRGLPLEEKPWRSASTLVSTSDPAVEEVALKIINGERLVVIYRHPVDLNPITGRNLSPALFFDERLSAVSETDTVVVLDYDEDRMSSPFTYVPSYRLTKIAVELPAFSRHRDALETALRAFDAPLDSELRKQSDPWLEGWQGGARFFAKVAGSLGKPVLALLRNVHCRRAFGGRGLRFDHAGEPIGNHGQVLRRDCVSHLVGLAGRRVPVGHCGVRLVLPVVLDGDP